MVLDNKITTYLEVCRQGNLTKAAENLYITQPAVTQQMKALEEYYDCRLFTYAGKKLCLTKQGEELYHYALAMMVNQQRFKQRMSDADQFRKKLNFGATLTLGEFVLPKLLIGYQRANPEVEINMIVDNTMDLLRHLKTGDIDFAFIEGYYEKADYDSMPFFEDNFIGVCSSQSSLAEQTLSIADLYRTRLIIREDGSGTREVLERTLSLYNSSVNDWDYLAKVGNINAIKEMVKADLGISFMYESAVLEELNNQSLCKLKIKDFRVKREYTIVTLKESNLTEQRDHLLSWYRNLNDID